MNGSDDDLRQEIALFRYTVIADLVHLPVGARGIGDKLRDKASQSYTIPGSDRTHVAANTIRGWVRLGHLIDLRGIGMLTGEVGSGKTTVCRHLTAQLHPGLYRVHYVSLTTGNVLDMYKSIAWEIGIAVERSRSSAHHAIRTKITRLANEAKQLPVLVVDEAHHLRNDVLEDLRLLTNFAMDAEQRMCLILVGLTELRRRLSMAVHESLSQRLVVRHHLTGLDREEVDAYLTHRLRLAGCELPLFEAPAVEALFQSARGLPRQINRIAHYALAAAALDKARTVNADHLQHALDELRP